MKLSISEILAAMAGAYEAALADPAPVRNIQIGEGVTLRTDVYRGPRGDGFQVVATVDRGYDTLTICRQRGPEIEREKPFVPVSYSKLSFLREIQKLGKLGTFIGYLELPSHKTLKWQWDACTCIMSDDETFSEIAPLVQTLLGITGPQFSELLKRCES